MAKIQTLRDDTLEKVFLRNSLDAIYKSVNSETSILTSEGKIKAELLDVEVPVANGTASGIVYNSDTDRLTITSGGIAINAYTSNLTSATTTANKKKVPTVSAVQAYVSGATTGCVTYTTNTSSSLNSKINKKQDTMSEGFGIIISGGTAVSLARSRPITTIPAASTTVTLEPGEAYIVDATTTSKTLELGSGVPSGKFGLESHIELFVANTGYIHTGSNVTLIDPLEPDAVNDCTVRFHDGHAIISVEDHVQAYMVQNTSTTYTTGTFAYGLGQVSVTASNYIGFRSELNGSSVPTGGQSATNLKHIVGNGMDIGPTITGNLIIKSGATIRDIKTSGLVVMSGTAKVTDVFVSSGATLSIGTNGGLTIERLYGNGGTINLGGKNVVISSGTTAIASGCTFSGGIAHSAYNGGGAFLVKSGAELVLHSATVTGNSGYNGGGIATDASGKVSLYDCVVTGNVGGSGTDIFESAGNVLISGCTVGHLAMLVGTTTIAGSNHIDRITSAYGAGGSIAISSGAIVDLTGNANATPIATGGSITFEAGGATVIDSAGNHCYIDNFSASYISNDNTVTVVGAGSATRMYVLPSYASGATIELITNGSFAVSDGADHTCVLKDCVVRSRNYIYIEAYQHKSGILVIEGHVRFDHVLTYGSNVVAPTVQLENDAVVDFKGGTQTGSYLINCTLGSLIVKSGCSVVLVDGSTVALTGGTYHTLSNTGVLA